MAAILAAMAIACAKDPRCATTAGGLVLASGPVAAPAAAATVELAPEAAVVVTATGLAWVCHWMLSYESTGGGSGADPPAPEPGEAPDPSGDNDGSNFPRYHYSEERGAGFSFSDHAIEQIEERALIPEDVFSALDEGEEFAYKDLVSGDARVGYYDEESQTFVGTDSEGNVTTAIGRVLRQYIDNLKAR